MVEGLCGVDKAMKVKVGDRVYSSEDQPIMIILTMEDKYNISHMAGDAMRYAEFKSSHGMTTEQMLEWMKDEEAVAEDIFGGMGGTEPDP